MMQDFHMRDDDKYEKRASGLQACSQREHVAVPRTGTGAARGIEILLGLKIDVQRAGSCWVARQAEEAGGGERAER